MKKAGCGKILSLPRMAFIGYSIFLLSDINMIEMKINCVLYVMKM